MYIMALSSKCFTYILSKSAQFPYLYVIIVSVFLVSKLTDKFIKIIHLMNVLDKMEL